MCIICVPTNNKSKKTVSATLFPSQQGLLDAGYGESDEHWLICAPTGSGKTRMGEWAIERAWTAGHTAAYVAPLRAIVEERVTDWQRRYPHRTVKAFTGRGEVTMRPTGEEDLMLFTPEKLATYLAGWKNHLEWISRLDVLVIDEFHLLGDHARGATLECLIGRIERVNPFLRVVGLSATLPNARELADWMRARLYETTWRPVTVTHRLRRYKRAMDKPECLLEEVSDTLGEAGRALVFVNSRRRAEHLAAYLRTNGLNAKFTHAGQLPEEQADIHRQMRDGEVDAVVATSTLEMGVNLPARKVVVYDNYAFEGDTFRPLPVQRYLQFAGRAGRPGLDDRGECVLFAPVWDGSAEQTLRGTPDPVKSTLFSTHHLAREILHEASSRLSISERHLEVNFSRRTFWRHQGGQRRIDAAVRFLVDGGLLKETEKDDKTYLSHTALGRIATQMAVSPETVVLLRRVFRQIEHPSEWDVLLAACLSAEVTPKLGFRFEEIDHIGDAVMQAPGLVLDWAPATVMALRPGCSTPGLLSAVKCTALIDAYTRLESIETLADRHDCYPSDLITLKRNVVWVLEAAQRVFAVLNRQRLRSTDGTDEEQTPPPPSLHEEVVRALKLMVEYGIPRGAISLVNVVEVGSKRAQRLCSEGVFTPFDLSQLTVAHLIDVLGIGERTAMKIHESAVSLAHQDPPSQPQPPVGRSKLKTQDVLRAARAGIDPYRLRRALDLTVDHASAELVRVSGGAEPHTIVVHEDALRKRSYTCDCADFAKGQLSCKHVLRARVALHDDADIRPWLDALRQPYADRPLRYALGDLWMTAGRTVERYADRADWPLGSKRR
jgi:helicase